MVKNANRATIECTNFDFINCFIKPQCPKLSQLKHRKLTEKNRVNIPLSTLYVDMLKVFLIYFFSSYSDNVKLSVECTGKCKSCTLNKNVYSYLGPPNICYSISVNPLTCN